MLDSTDKVRKNQKIPKEINLYLLNSRTPIDKIPATRQNLNRFLVQRIPKIQDNHSPD
jgi:hypothetical protein